MTFRELRALIVIMKKLRGFTLVELMVVIAIAGLVLAFGMPALSPFIQNGRITTVTNDLISALYVARSEAIRMGSTGCVCPSNNPTAGADATCNATDNWEMGWISFLDNSTGNCTFDGGIDGGGTDVLLKVWDGSSYSDKMTVRATNDNNSINAVDYVRFNSRGATLTSGGVMQQGVFNICDSRGVADVNGKSVARGVQMTIAGSVKSTNRSSLITCP
ncbi:MAG: GspH/FimT family pseudopilin [Gammaproteobacteria bacterium]|nr:GspH/FimT family pseudopilin [Gammaproteobacteria bacterium]MDH5735691.1 GspH/FimT family pseudopilin [Gammaproteobacteria bacterium]